jgi:cytochrome c biogenesis protein CcdA
VKSHRLAVLALAAVVAISGTDRVFAQSAPRATVTPFVSADRVTAGQSLRVALQVSLPEKTHVNSNAPRDPNLIPLTLAFDSPAGISVAEVVYPPATDLKQEDLPEPLLVFEREFLIGVELKIAGDAKPGTMTVPVRMRYQACNDKMCFLPQTASSGWTFTIGAAAGPRLHSDVFDRIPFGQGEAPSAAAAPKAAPNVSDEPLADTLARIDRFEILGTTSGYMGTADFVRFIRNSEQGIRETGVLEGRGPLAVLLLVFLGGLALNLTPCVLPMIPINLAIIGAGSRAGSKSRGLLLGATYGAAMAAVYGVLGLVVILTAGTFGAINSSPWFNAAIAVLFVALGLAMFDVFEIDFSRFSSGVSVGESGRGTVLVALGMGAISALLAGACVAPIVIQVVVLATNLYAKGTTMALALPFVLGLGMALPWPVAGAGIAAMPRPGAWMVRVKQVLGAIVLATAAYYAYEAYALMSDRWADPEVVKRGVEEQLKAGWNPSLANGLAAAERDRKPILIDMWATWCKSCGTMDLTTLRTAEVTSALSNYVKIKFQADDPDDPAVAAIMKRFDAYGLPTYVIARPK